MIIYFTGTGNSKYMADYLADRLEDTVISMSEIVRKNLPRSFQSEKPYVIVCPIYAWRIPPFVDEFIRGSEFSGNRKMYVVVTMGANSGKADRYASETVSSKGLEFMGLCGIAMSDNYLVWSDMPDADTVRETNRRALEAAAPVAERISKGERIEKTDRTRLAGLKSGVINNMFSKHMNSHDFAVSDSCSGCSTCADFCPSGNIAMENGKPVFGKHCLSCFGCINRCPETAIDIKGKTEKRGRFLCPEYVRE